MAKFTASVPLNIEWFGNQISGAAGATHRIPDALYDEFNAAFSGKIPGLTWVTQDETTTFLPTSGGTVSGAVTVTGALTAGSVISPAVTATSIATSSLTGSTIVGAAVTATTARFKGQPWYDVMAYGAVGDGVANDAPAIQAAITAAYNAGGGVVNFPKGNFKISTPGLSLPTSAQYGVTLQGSGMGPVGGVGPTIIVRDGAFTGLIAAGTGTSIATVSNGLCIRDMTIDGGGYSANLINLDRSAAGIFENVRLTNSTGRLLTSNQMWNWRFVNCNFEQAGSSATNSAAVYLTCPDANEQTATVMFDNCIFEGNYWDDVQLDGTAGRLTLGVVFTNCKWERNVAGRCLYLLNASYCQAIGGSMTQLNTNSKPMIVQDAGSYNSVIGMYIYNQDYAGGAAIADYGIQINGGTGITIVGCTFSGAKTAHIRLEAAAGVATIGPNMHQHAGQANAAAVSDARATIPRGMLIGNIGVLGTATTSSALLQTLGGTSANTVALGTRWIRTTAGTAWDTTAFQFSLDVDTTIGAGAILQLLASGNVKTPGKFLATGGIGVGNSASATTPGSVTKKIEVFDASGNSLGFIPVYGSIT